MSDEREEWRAVVGFEGYYEVSDMGQVRSVARVVRIRSRWGGWRLRPYFQRPLRTHTAGGGYLSLKLYRNRVKRAVYVHQLVAQAFLPPPPPGMTEVNHKNADKIDNRPSNLEWTTHAANMAHAAANGCFKRGAENPCAKLTDEQVRWARAMRGRLSQAKIARALGVSQSAISLIQLRKTYQDVELQPKHSAGRMLASETRER